MALQVALGGSDGQRNAILGNASACEADVGVLAVRDGCVSASVKSVISALIE